MIRPTKNTWPIWVSVMLAGALVVVLMQHCGPTPENTTLADLRAARDSIRVLHKQKDALAASRVALAAQLRADSVRTRLLRHSMDSAASQEAYWKTVADSFSTLADNDSTNPAWRRRALADEQQVTACHSQLNDCARIHEIDSTEIVRWRGISDQAQTLADAALLRADSLAALAGRMPQTRVCRVLGFIPCPTRKAAFMTGLVGGVAGAVLLPRVRR